MSTYGQFCPISKAVEVLGERWTMLLIREMLMGSKRFNELQRGLAKMSPSLLTKRLKDLEAAGLIHRSKISGQKGYEYFLTSAGKELQPLVMELGKWGMKWVNDSLSQEELDVDLLMWDIRRNIKHAHIPSGKATIKFYFDELSQYKNWWLVIENGQVDLCTESPGEEADLYIISDVYTITQIWMANLTWSQARKQNLVKFSGSPFLEKEISQWLGTSRMAAFNPRVAKA